MGALAGVERVRESDVREVEIRIGGLMGAAEVIAAAAKLTNCRR